jgi:hypothetical protein
MSWRNESIATPFELWVLATIAGTCAMFGPGWGFVVALTSLLGLIAYRKITGG